MRITTSHCPSLLSGISLLSLFLGGFSILLNCPETNIRFMIKRFGDKKNRLDYQPLSGNMSQ